MFKWEYGRQGGGYKKLTLINSKRLKLDAYLLYFPVLSDVPAHKDPSPEGYEHHRINITLEDSQLGGRIHVNGPQKVFGPIQYFRPDLYEHWMTMIARGQKLILSIGWLRKCKH